MKLSVVIVNYNVEHFLEQCLNSVFHASKNIETEVFVVDNNSVDGSLNMLSEKFPDVNVIANKENVGFSRANNQAIAISTGEYVLLLNPDTVVEDDTFDKVIGFMDSHPDAGGLGVKMLDGHGNFLPESKRGLPTPMTAFYKMFGLIKLFPKSKRIAHYYMGHLSPDETNEVEILAGAFMLLRRKTLDKCGLLDETFFMYGEDIDLSYRILLSGYKNYYFPETRIIHYKGESTKKTSVNYVVVFYKAMKIFARKHFRKKGAGLFSLGIDMAIYLRAFIAVIQQFVRKMALPLLDFIVGYAGIAVIARLWEATTLYGRGSEFTEGYWLGLLPASLFIWQLMIFVCGGYDRPYRVPKSILGTVVGTIVFLILYALLPNTLRFSRMLILLGTLWMVFGVSLIRSIGYLLKIDGFRYGRNDQKRIVIIGGREEVARVENLIRSTTVNPDFVGLVSCDDERADNEMFIGNITQIPDIIEIYDINMVVFCSKDMKHQTIIDKMTEWNASEVNYKIAPANSDAIIGSNSINTLGDLYLMNLSTINKPVNRRNKRIFDVVSSLLCIMLWIPSALFIKKPFAFLKKSILVLMGKRTWVGYCQHENVSSLPRIKKGVFTPASELSDVDAATLGELNCNYAKNYTVLTDINLFFRQFGKI